MCMRNTGQILAEVGNEDAVQASDSGHGWVVLSTCSNWLIERLSPPLLGGPAIAVCPDCNSAASILLCLGKKAPFSASHHLSPSVIKVHM